MSKVRLLFIDALRALAIIAVILGHLPIYCYDGHYSVLTVCVATFHMPLFMMLSGYVTNISKFSLISRLKILIPFFIIGLSYTFMTDGDFVSFFTSESKNGYWFLWVIVLYFIVLHLIRICKVKLLVAVICVELIFISLHFFFRRTLVGTTISTDYLWQMWPAFATGVFIHDVFIDKIKNRVMEMMGGSLFLGLIMLFVGNHFTNEIIHKLLFVAAGIPLAIFFMVLFYYTEMRLKRKDFWGKNCLKKMTTAIGTQTLQVYTLHYFVLYLLSVLGIQNLISFMDDMSLGYVVLVVSPLVAFMIACICIGLARMIYAIRLGTIFGR